jgi:hypothetical protein
MVVCVVVSGLVPLLVGVCGCGSSGPDTGSVDGRIMYQGQPVTEGTVVFENAARGWLRVAPLDEQGEYHIKDVHVAEYSVSVRPPDPKLPNETTGTAKRIVITPSMFPDPANIPKRFRSVDTSPLKTSVVAGTNHVDYDLARPPGN